MRLRVIVALAGCGSAPVKPPTVTTTPPSRDAAVIDDAPTEDCETASAIISAGTVELVTYHMGDQSPSPQAEQQGFVEHLMRADLALRTPKGSVVKALSSWTNGWEWGTEWKIAGTLTDGHGSDAVLLVATANGPASGIAAFVATLHAFAVVRGDWAEVYSTSANSIDVDLAPGGTLARLARCVASTANAPVGCSSYLDAEPGPSATLRWDGKQIVAGP